MTKQFTDELIVQVVVTTHNKQGLVLKREIAQPISVFRAATRDIWAECDKQLAVMQKTQVVPPSSPPPVPPRSSKKR